MLLGIDIVVARVVWFWILLVTIGVDARYADNIHEVVCI